MRCCICHWVSTWRSCSTSPGSRSRCLPALMLRCSLRFASRPCTPHQASHVEGCSASHTAPHQVSNAINLSIGIYLECLTPLSWHLPLIGIYLSVGYLNKGGYCNSRCGRDVSVFTVLEISCQHYHQHLVISYITISNTITPCASHVAWQDVLVRITVSVVEAGVQWQHGPALTNPHQLSQGAHMQADTSALCFGLSIFFMHLQMA